MTQTVYERYLEEEVLSADPVKLVWLLYRGAIDVVRSARGFLDQRDIRGRVRQINRGLAMIQELAASLNRDEGAEISERLAALYAYMQSRLIEANTQQSGAPLEEVETLLLTLAEAWTPAASHVRTRELGEQEAYELDGLTEDEEPEHAALAVG